MASNFLECATPLLERGFSLIPLMARDKKPQPGFGVTKKSNDPAVIAEWAEKYPDANVAVCADKTYMVLDADDADALWAEFATDTKHGHDCNAYGVSKPSTYAVESSPGKAHYYFKRDANGGLYWNLELGKLGSLRADNQYVVGAGSIHPKTSEAYKVINDAPVAVMGQELFERLRAAAETAEREVRRIVADWDGTSSIPAGQRQTILKHLAGKWWDGEISEEELTEKLLAVNAQCIPPKPESEIRRLAAWVVKKDPNRKGPEVIFGSPRSFGDEDYALDPLDGSEFSGWFPRGSITLVAGGSGAMKTTLLTQALVNARNGETFLGHRGMRMPFIFFYADRAERDARQTLKRMRYVDQVPFECINELDMDQSLEKMVEYAKTDHYPTMVLDGGDLLVADSGDGGQVKRFMSSLQKLIKHYGLAFIVTLGSSKYATKAIKEGAERRTLVKGSEVWNRVGGTIFTLTSADDGTNDTRELVVQHRNAATERYVFKLREGRLELFVATDVPVPEDSNMVAVIDWIKGQEEFTKTEFAAAFPTWSGRERNRILDALMALREVRELGGRPAKYKVRINPKATQSDVNFTSDSTPNGSNPKRVN